MRTCAACACICGCARELWLKAISFFENGNFQARFTVSGWREWACRVGPPYRDADLRDALVRGVMPEVCEEGRFHGRRFFG